MRRRSARVRWHSSPGALTMLEPGAPGTDPGRRVPADRMPRPVVVLCVVVGAFGVLVMVMSGGSILDGDFTSTGSGRRGWVTPPIAFLIGLGLALAPLGIAWQERGFGRLGAVGTWHSTMVLNRESVTVIHGAVGSQWPWSLMTPERMSGVPTTGRPVVQHYLDHPEHRDELGTSAGMKRAACLVNGRTAGVVHS